MGIIHTSRSTTAPTWNNRTDLQAEELSDQLSNVQWKYCYSFTSACVHYLFNILLDMVIYNNNKGSRCVLSFQDIVSCLNFRALPNLHLFVLPFSSQLVVVWIVCLECVLLFALSCRPPICFYVLCTVENMYMIFKDEMATNCENDDRGLPQGTCIL